MIATAVGVLIGIITNMVLAVEFERRELAKPTRSSPPAVVGAFAAITILSAAVGTAVSWAISQF